MDDLEGLRSILTVEVESRKWTLKPFLYIMTDKLMVYFRKKALERH